MPTVVQVEVAAADGAPRHLQDDISILDDRRLGCINFTNQSQPPDLSYSGAPPG